MKIRTKLGITYLALSLLVLSLFSFSFFTYSKKILTNDVLEHLQSVASIQQNRINGIVDQNRERIRLVSSRTQLRISLNNYLISGDRIHLPKIQRILHDALQSINSFNLISVLDVSGKTLVSTDADKAGMNYKSYDFFEPSLKRNTVKYFFLNAAGELKIHLAGPLYFENQLIGMLLIESSVNNIVSSLKDYSGLGDTGETLLGRLSADARFVEFLSPLRFDDTAALRKIIPIENKSAPIIKAVLRNTQNDFDGIDYRNQPVLLTTRFIEQTAWGVVVKIDRKEAYAPISDFIYYFVLITVGVILLIVLLSYLLANMISKPVVELTRVAREVHEGDLSQRAIINSTDEFGELANNFNNMTNSLVLTQFDLEKSNAELEKHRDHLEELVSKRTQELETVNQELESFAYSVSHDLRGPLRAIDGFCHIILEDYEKSFDADGKMYFLRIRNATERMGKLIDDILDLSRINRGEICKTEFSLSQQVEFSINNLNVENSDREVDFSIKRAINVFADEALIQVVINNLIDNAWKYTSKNRCSRIEFGVQHVDGEEVFYVRDDGIGFDMQYVDKLFSTFQRLVHQKEFPGTGIGLATVDRIIARHDGRIWAESELGNGATFFFTLPNEKAA